MAKKTTSAVERFWAHVQKSDGCWLWQGAKGQKGYGRFKVAGRLVAAHRFAYETVVGLISARAMVLHSCDTPACCNPAHLSLGTNSDNMLDCSRKGRMAGIRRRSGEQHPSAKLRAQQVIEIRARLSVGATRKGLAREYGVSDQTIRHIATGKKWKAIA